MEILFDLEASDQTAAFFGLYAGLRMYKEVKDAQPKEEGAFSIAAAENYCRIIQTPSDRNYSTMHHNWVLLKKLPNIPTDIKFSVRYRTPDNNCTELFRITYDGEITIKGDTLTVVKELIKTINELECKIITNE